LTNQKKQQEGIVEASFTTFPLDPKSFQLTVMANDIMETSISNTITLEEEEKKRISFWHTLSQYKSLPFCKDGQRNLTLFLGGHFYHDGNDDHQFSQEIQQAFLYLEDILSHHQEEMVYFEQNGQLLSSFHRRQIELLLKRLYYNKWNLPGVQQSLANGSNLFLFHAKQEAMASISSTSISSTTTSIGVYLLQMLTNIHQKYQQLLWFQPFFDVDKQSVDIGGGQMEKNQIKTHVWGRFGLMYLQPDDFGELSTKTWQQINTFLTSTHQLLHVSIVSSYPFLMDSFEDTTTKVDFFFPMVSNTITDRKSQMSPQTIDRLLKIIFTWKQQPVPVYVSKNVQQIKEIVFLSGHSFFGLNTLIQEIKTNQFVHQFIVGPLVQQKKKLFVSFFLEKEKEKEKEKVEEEEVRRKTLLLPSGSLGDQFVYTHSYLERKFPSQLIQQFMIIEANIQKKNKNSTTTTSTSTSTSTITSTTTATGPLLLMDQQVKATTNCRVISLLYANTPEEDITTTDHKKKKKASTTDSNTLTEGKTKVVIPVEVEEENELNVTRNNVKFEHIWELERVLQWPKWLEAKWKKPLNEQDQIQVKQLHALMEMNLDKLKRTFPLEFRDENAMVLFKEYEKSVPLITQGIVQFHHNVSTALRALYGIHPPSSIMVLLVLDFFFNHSSKTQQQEFLTQQDIYVHIVIQVYEKSLVLVHKNYYEE
jgi:hypothetical protein